MRRGKKQSYVEWGRGGTAHQRSSSPLFFTRILPRCLAHSVLRADQGGEERRGSSQLSRASPGQPAGPGFRHRSMAAAERGPVSHMASSCPPGTSKPASFLPLPEFISGIPSNEKCACPSDPLQSHLWQLGSNFTGGACCDKPAKRSWRQHLVLAWGLPARWTALHLLTRTLWRGHRGGYPLDCHRAA